MSNWQIGISKTSEELGFESRDLENDITENKFERSKHLKAYSPWLSDTETP